MSLYHINEQLDHLINRYHEGTITLEMDYDAHGNETDDLQSAILDDIYKLDMKKNDLLLEMGTMIRNYQSEIDSRVNEIEYQKNHVDKLHRRIDMLCEQISTNLPFGEKLGDHRVQISYRKSSAIVIDCDIKDLPQEFVRQKPQPAPEPDKMALKQAIKNNQLIPGVSIVENHNLQVK